MAISREEFIQKLSDSQLMLAGDVQDFEKKLTPPPAAHDIQGLAHELVRHFRLTDFQVEILFERRSDPLRVGDYFILDKVGQGGMGIVYKARPVSSYQLVALKMMPPEMSDPRAIKRFRREVEVASQLKHPNVVATIGAGEHNDREFLVMEFVDGYNLESLLGIENSLPVLTAVDLILDAARGLLYAHQQDVIHRDIKPSNLLIHRDGTVKILDLGLARVVKSDAGSSSSSTTVTELTGAGAVMGTADYIAPEQAVNSRNADHRSDIYSLGCTLFFAFTGKTMYRGETAMEKIVAHREQSIPNLQDHRDDIVPDLERIYHRMVAKNPQQRYQTMEEVIRDFEKCRAEFGHMWMIRRRVSEKKKGDPR